MTTIHDRAGLTVHGDPPPKAPPKLARPSRLLADNKLRIALAEHSPAESIGVVLVRCPSWDGGDKVLAFRGVVLSDDDTARDVLIAVDSDWRCFVSLIGQPAHKPVAALAYFLSTSHDLCNEPGENR